MTVRVTTAMILAAGRGTRMAPLTDHCPKPLLSLAGKPLIEHHLEKLALAGFRQVVINHSYLGHLLPERLGNGERWGLRIHYSAESSPLETAGGIIQALPYLGAEPFALINGDVWTDMDYSELATASFSPEQWGCLWLVDNPRHHERGDFVLQNNGLLALPSTNTESCLTFSGLSVLSPTLFSGLTEGKRPLAPVLRLAISQQQLCGRYLSHHWVDVGTPERLAELDMYLQSNSERILADRGGV